MDNCKEEKSVVPLKEKKATIKDEDWREKCRDCEILIRFSDCTFGCEFIMDSQRKRSKNK